LFDALVRRTGWPPPEHHHHRGARRDTGNAPMTVLKILLAILLPPVGVFMEVGLGLQFWLNVLLTILGYVPGIIHALIVITSR